MLLIQADRCFFLFSQRIQFWLSRNQIDYVYANHTIHHATSKLTLYIISTYFPILWWFPDISVFIMKTIAGQVSILDRCQPSRVEKDYFLLWTSYFIGSQCLDDSKKIDNNGIEAVDTQLLPYWHTYNAGTHRYLWNESSYTHSMDNRGNCELVRTLCNNCPHIVLTFSK